MKDILLEKTLKLVEDSIEPLETKEILENLKTSVKDITRTKLFYRLMNLRGEGLIKGKFVGPGKGVWIWWSKTIFSNKSKGGKK